MLSYDFNKGYSIRNKVDTQSEEYECKLKEAIMNKISLFVYEHTEDKI